jgi:CTP synthase
VPHITNEIKDGVLKVAEGVDVVIAEIGGTIGDIESLPFLEAIRQFKYDVGKQHVVYVHLTLVPYIAAAGELKTKPTQHSVKELMQIGIQPDVLLCRTDRFLSEEIKSKIALFCNVKEEAVITAKDVESIYQVPLFFKQEGLDQIIIDLLDLGKKGGKSDLKEWERLVLKQQNLKHTTNVAIVGKYVNLQDSYKSLNEALVHGGVDNNAAVILNWVDAVDIEKNGVEAHLSQADGILVPGGFGGRGIEGKIQAVRHARLNDIPYFGICLGMHCATIEFARNVCGLSGANSAEFDEESPNPVIDLLHTQKGVKDKGGTMRLGQYPCRLDKKSQAYKAYNKQYIDERHRHRYEFNNRYREDFAAKGLKFSGLSPDGELVEIVEVENHPWFVACQFHPEFKSNLRNPHPLFRDFIAASLKYNRGKK